MSPTGPFALAFSGSRSANLMAQPDAPGWHWSRLVLSYHPDSQGYQLVNDASFGAIHLSHGRRKVCNLGAQHCMIKETAARRSKPPDPRRANGDRP